MPDRLDEVLRQAQDLGLLGPGPIEAHRRHAEAFCGLALSGLGDELRFVDLGSGGGLPGLVLAARAPAATGVLLDSQHRRTRFLSHALEALDLSDRLQVVTARAETTARSSAHRERYGLVVARGFAAPAATAECAAALVHPGGRLAVSEPPDEDPERWDRASLEDLGLSPPTVVGSEGATAALFRKVAPTPDRWPRRPGIPTKRPLW